MGERRPGGGSFVLEDQTVQEPAIALEVDQSVAVGPEDFADILDRKPGQIGFRVRAFDDDFVRADAVHHVVDAVAALVEFAFDLQSGELVRHHADPPTGTIWF